MDRCRSFFRATAWAASSATPRRAPSRPGADGHIAAVDAHVFASHEAGAVTGQERDHVGDVLARANASDWLGFAPAGKSGLHAIRLARGGCAHHLGVDRAWADREHPNAFRGIL